MLSTEGEEGWNSRPRFGGNCGVMPKVGWLDDKLRAKRKDRKGLEAKALLYLIGGN